ncbi:gephyrin-like molybdotransferase Glp [Streptosporangium sp. NPDC000239]|uniref:molybdotransferase-like divisome protein Glp n=1 Tax=Streptosporangium sp. NPDC000239 TaxID=3154248 RepID=UPI00332F58A2
MRSVDEHLADILLAVRPTAPRETGLQETLGTVLAEDVASPVALPPFANSAMDGYAVRACDVAEVPVTLPVTGDVAAGEGGRPVVAPGTAMRIMTGAPMPEGADTVIPVEWTDGGREQARFERSAPAGNAIRLAGEDVLAGDVVLPEGTLIGPAQLGILAGVGRAHALVRPRPRVVVISTGSELAEPGTPLGPGQIWESNSYALAAAVREAGGEAYRAGITADDATGFLDQLNAHLPEVDAVITSGGVSMGAYEPVKEALGDLDTFRFEKVAMQPGMPQGFGVAGEGRIPVFALPGNPVSSFVSFVLFVGPALRKMRGLEPGPVPAVRAVTLAPLRSPQGKRSYLRAVLTGGSVTPVTRQGSHQLAALATANALIVIDEDVTAVPEGTEVEVIPL